jgi:hypothetical protein
MSYLYVTTAEYGLLGEVVAELRGQGLAAGQIRIFSTQPERFEGMAATTARYRPPAANAAFGAAVGALAGLGLGLLLMLFGFGIAPVLLLIAALGIGGALSRRWFGHGLSGELYRLDSVMRAGHAVMVLDVDNGQAAELKSSLAQRHPELAVLGTDTDGTPPFP